MPEPSSLVHLATARTSVVVDCTVGVPVIRHWGRPIGEQASLVGLEAALDRGLPVAGLDVEAPLSLVPEHGAGHPGRPGLGGHRQGGRDWAPRFGPIDHDVAGSTLTARAVDPIAELQLDVTLSLSEQTEALEVQLTLTNLGSTRYLLDWLDVTLPVSGDAAELLVTTGRWSRELQPTRFPWPPGTWVAENRRGRTSHDHLPLVFAGTAGFGEWSGEVWGAHLAWSGNHRVSAERLADGRRLLQLGELLHPGELALEPGDAYRTPRVVAVHGADGLTPACWGFHRTVRARPGHPGPERPRPVLANTWEARYFDHDPDALVRLADVAASLGVERFVIDDGWFHGRRHDRAGLGDWWVDPAVYPDGLGPVLAHVRSLGLEPGIWVEPEMVNPDSDLARAHPDWVLADPRYEPVLGRHQLVLDLTRPDAFEHVLGLLDALLADHDLGFVKWDMNRDHAQASGTRGAAATHAQTLAVYRLLDELRARHPEVEIESCASGGGRIDLEVLRRAERVWTSDSNDPLERQRIQRGASLLLPAEVIGAHIGPSPAHTSGRRTRLAFRGATALFGHLGLELDLVALDDREREALRSVIALHQRFRPLLHGGNSVRFDVADPGALAHGVYAGDRSEALVAYVQLDSAETSAVAPWRLPGLDSARRYRVERIRLPGEPAPMAHAEPAWCRSGAHLTGAQLAAHGLQPPSLLPLTALLVHLVADAV